MPQHRVRRPTLAEEEQRRTIGLDDPDLRVEPADLNMAGSVGDRDDAVGRAEIHADCNRNHSKTALVTTHAKEKGYVSLQASCALGSKIRGAGQNTLAMTCVAPLGRL